MALRRNGRAVRPPELPYSEAAGKLAFPKRKHMKPDPDAEATPIDTRDLRHRKIHPDRDDEYKQWLRPKLCSVYLMRDQWTDQLHRCWSPERVSGGKYASDPAHSGKAYSGKVKRSDSGCFPLCRLAHNLQEDAMNKFDERFGINRHEIAARLYAEFIDEMQRKGRR